MDEAAGSGDCGWFAAFVDDCQGLRVLAEFRCEVFQEGDHRVVALRVDCSCLEISRVKILDDFGAQQLAADFFEHLFKIVFVRLAVENLSGFEVGDDR